MLATITPGWPRSGYCCNCTSYLWLFYPK